ncbi:MAG: hypothetical protein COB53_10365 [Elusimicrobia bacterium]|nr:MAG: hypothetical protein COB53_10365 [Elusimicrobiota bacterium]
MEYTEVVDCSRMKIGLEISGALGVGGYRRYVEDIVNALTEAAPEIDFYLYAAFWGGFPDRAKSLNIHPRSNVHWILKRVPQRLVLPLDEYFGLGIQNALLRPYNLDLLHGLCSILPQVTGIKTVMTMHYAGEWPFRGLWNRFYNVRLNSASMERADRVIAISDYTLGEIRKTWPLPGERFAIVHHGGPSVEFRPAEPEEKKPQDFKPYMLSVGAIKVPKNPVLVIKAFAAFKKNNPESAHRLLFAGPDGDQAVAAREEVRGSGLEKSVEFLGAISSERIPELYRHAAVVLCPSTTEGFAFPVLEAFASGRPVIGVNRAALPETIGDAGLLCEPTPESLSEAMGKVVNDEDLCSRLTAAGRIRAKEFSWANAAQKTLAVYKGLLS